MYKAKRAIIMAAGLGNRMHPITLTVPKPLVTVNGVRMIDTVIQALQNGETPEKEVYMTEHWFVNEDILSSITVNGESQDLTVVDQTIIDAQY